MYLIRERLFDVGDDFDITDESGQRVFHVDGKLLSPRDRLVISDASGREVATVHRKLIALRRTCAAEFACCSFFTFTLTVGPPGVRFTVTAPDEARDVVTSMFGAAVGA